MRSPVNQFPSALISHMNSSFDRRDFLKKSLAISAMSMLSPKMMQLAHGMGRLPSNKIGNRALNQRENIEVNKRKAFIISPEYTQTISRHPWVWYAPTLPGLPGAEEGWMIQHFLDNGIAMAGIDVGESMGNRKGVNLFSDLYAEMVKRNYSKRPVLLARSRGGLMLYNWASRNPRKTGAIAGIYPVCDLRSYPGIKNAALAHDMSERKLIKILYRYNPVSLLKPLAKNDVPILHLHGDQDAVVPLEENSAEVERKYREYGGNMQLLIQHGHGHDMWEGFFKSTELVNFVIKHAVHRV